MAREKGSSIFASNLEVRKGAALDPRMVVGTRAELFLSETWPSEDGIIFLYNGLVVSVLEDQGLYLLTDSDNYNTESAWIKLGQDLEDRVYKNEEVTAAALVDLETRKTTLEEVDSIYIKKEDLSTALKYCGITTTNIVDDSTASTVIIDGSNHTATAGCVVFYGDKEFVYNGNKWEELGYPTNLSNYKTKQTAVSSPSSSGTALAFIDTISQNANGVITATKKNVKLSGDSVTLSSSYEPAVYPEDTGDGEFTSLTSGESLDSAIKKLDQNIANLVQETLDNEEVISSAITDLSDRFDKNVELLSDEPQKLKVSFGGLPVYKKVITLEYILPNEETVWEIPCVDPDTVSVYVLSMKCILRQSLPDVGIVSFEYRDHYLFGESGNILNYYFNHSTGSMVIKFTSEVTTSLVGIIEYACSENEIIDGGDSTSTLVADDTLDSGYSI